MTDFVFVHGWGFDPSFWCPLSAHFQNHNTVYVDLGFFGQNKTIKAPQEAVYITHSMGLGWVTQFVTEPRAVIAINGFTRFCSSDDWSEGVNPRVLSRMIRQFDRGPREVWGEFMKNCGLKAPELAEHADFATLSDGLKELQNFDIRSSYQKLNCPKLAISATGDLIVPEKLTTASFGEDVIWYKGANHLLPLFEHQTLAEHIRCFLDRCLSE